MPSQSDALSAETKAMRAIDLALQQAGQLPVKARDRVLRYAADEVADRLGQPSPNGGQGGSTSFGDVVVAGGGGGGRGPAASVTHGGPG